MGFSDCRLFVDDVGMVSGMMKTTFFIDIDQTISTGHVCRTLVESIAHYRGLGLDIPDVETWPALFQLPEILRRHEPLPRARTGVWRLACYGNVYYATVRAPDVRQITREWLHEQGFPLPDRVVLCRSIVHKLRELAQHPGRLVLIDDRWRVALEQWPRLVEIDPAAASVLRDRLTLVAFGSSQADLPESSVVPVVPLQDWSLVADVLMYTREVVKKG
jgi:5'(3')-deoxyribonucleotidase